MGLRDRLKAGVKRVLGRGGEAPAAASAGTWGGGNPAAPVPARPAPAVPAPLEVSVEAAPTSGAVAPPEPTGSTAASLAEVPPAAAAAMAEVPPPAGAVEADDEAGPVAEAAVADALPAADHAVSGAVPVVEPPVVEAAPDAQPPDTEAPPVVEPPAVEAAPAPLPTSPLPRSVISDNDAPLRDAHIRASFATTEKAFHVRLVNEALGLDLLVPCEPGEYVLDAADRAGQELPSSCRNGGCLTCAGKLLEGETEMEEQYTLEEEHIAVGFRLLCCTRVTSDAVFVTHQQEEIA